MKPEIEVRSKMFAFSYSMGGWGGDHLKLQSSLVNRNNHNSVPIDPEFLFVLVHDPFGITIITKMQLNICERLVVTGTFICDMEIQMMGLHKTIIAKPRYRHCLAWARTKTKPMLLINTNVLTMHNLGHACVILLWLYSLGVKDFMESVVESMCSDVECIELMDSVASMDSNGNETISKLWRVAGSHSLPPTSDFVISILASSNACTGNRCEWSFVTVAREDWKFLLLGLGWGVVGWCGVGWGGCFWLPFLVHWSFNFQKIMTIEIWLLCETEN